MDLTDLTVADVLMISGVSTFADVILTGLEDSTLVFAGLTAGGLIHASAISGTSIFATVLIFAIADSTVISGKFIYLYHSLFGNTSKSGLHVPYIII
jgi:hypothetical protein